MRNLKLNFKKLIALAGTVIVIMTASGCAKKVDCKIPTYHAHKYVSTDGYTRYIPEEYEEYEGYQRQEEYKELSENKKDLQRYLDDKDLLRISDNVEKIKEVEQANQDFVEYRYAYTYLLPIPHIMHINKSTFVFFTYIPCTHYSWTKDENHSRLTGEKRYCTYSYTSYKIEKDEYGKYVLIPCLEHGSVLDNQEEYPYIRKEFFKVIDASKGIEADYEDLNGDDPDKIREEEMDENTELTEEDIKKTGQALIKKL